MIAGTAIGGVGVVLISAQSMLTVPIWVGLRIVSLTALEVLRNLLTLAGVAVLVLAGAGLLPFFGVQVVVAVALIPVTLVLARVGVRFGRGVRRTVLMQLLRETLPLAVAFAMSVIYFRVLVVLVSLLSTEVRPASSAPRSGSSRCCSACRRSSSRSRCRCSRSPATRTTLDSGARSRA